MNTPTISRTIKDFEHGELVRADTALRSFRDGGYSFTDAVGETVDNSIQAGAKHIRMDWVVVEVPKGGSRKRTVPQAESFAIGDDGNGIPPAILAKTLTVGFSTRYNDRNGIGRFGVGFKLAAISQAKRLEIYTCPEYLHAEEQTIEDGSTAWSYADENVDRRVFMTHLDLDEIGAGKQTVYETVEVDGFPEEYMHLVIDDHGEPVTGTLIVWRKPDRLNEQRAYAENVNEKLAELAYWLRRTYRYYLDTGIRISLQGEPRLLPYDPSFQISNPEAEALAPGHSMTGSVVDSGTIEIDGHEVGWRVCLAPEVTRLYEGGGGERGPDGVKQFGKLHIADNQGKLSFLRRNREISYTIVPRLLPSGVDKVDRYIGIEISFPPVLDEYFQVRHIKRGAEPVDKLRHQLRNEVKKPIEKARKDIRKRWSQTKKDEAVQKPEADVSGGRKMPETVAAEAEQRMPAGRAGQNVTVEQEEQLLRQAALDMGIKDVDAQDQFVERARQQPMLALDMGWPGKGLLDIDHLSRTVVVRINQRHPFVQEVYLPLREAVATELADLDEYGLRGLLERSKDAIDLLFFAYAKAENQHPDPDRAFGELREDWGKYAAVYLMKRDEIVVE
jgi:hypothetical protein